MLTGPNERINSGKGPAQHRDSVRELRLLPPPSSLLSTEDEVHNEKQDVSNKSRGKNFKVENGKCRQNGGRRGS